MVEAHFDLLWRSARRLGLDAGRAEDVAQKAFVIASEKIDSIELGKERAFLLGVVSKLSSDARKSAFYRSSVFSPEMMERAMDTRSRPESRLAEKELRGLLDAAIGSLDEDLRTVFVLSQIEDLSQPEIADALSIPMGTVASRLRRAKEELREQLRTWTDREVFQISPQLMKGVAT